VCLSLAEHAISIKGSADNVSIIVVRICDKTDPELDKSHRNHIAGVHNTAPSPVYGGMRNGINLEEVRRRRKEEGAGGEIVVVVVVVVLVALVVVVVTT